MCKDLNLIVSLYNKIIKYFMNKYFLLFILVCTEGYYGDHCMQPCQCPNENYICNPFRGCECKIGYGGDLCETREFISLHFLI